MSTRRGRPPSGNPKDKVVTVRLNATEHDVIKTAATAAGVAMSEYLRSSGLTRARRRTRDRVAEQAPYASGQGSAAE